MKRNYLYILFWICTLFGVSVSSARSEILPPTGLAAKTFQHEIFLTWNADEANAWEVVVDDRSPIRTSTPQYTLDSLVHNRQYTIKVRTIKGEDFSTFAVLQATTQNIQKSIDAPDRIPYLRTIRIDGITPKRLPLYFNDLANEKACITYKFNGHPITPIDNHLHLSSSAYKDKLEINIDEGEGRRWHIVYLISLER